MIKESIFFQEIAQGSSSVMLDDRLVYIKHAENRLSSEYDSLYESVFQEAKVRGIPTDYEADKNLIEDGVWTIEDENVIKDLDNKIEELEIEKKSQRIPSKCIAIARLITESKKELNKKENQKSGLKPATAEFIASMRVNDFFIMNSFFSDKDCTMKLYSQEDYEEMERPKIHELVAVYQKTIEKFSEDNIKHFVLSEFFSAYFSLYDGPFNMFGRYLVNLTKIQIVICFYLKIFKSIFENIPKIPKNIHRDPEALLEYAENYDPSSQSSRRSSKAGDADAGARIIFGANQDDVERMASGDEKPVSLRDLIQKASADGSNSVKLGDIMIM